MMDAGSAGRARRVAIVGAGAAGCFAAVELKRLLPEAEVTVFEAGKKPLAKVAITGGGRCNLTNSFEGITRLAEAYPRGEKIIRRAFARFDHIRCMEWWESEGVALTVQPDHCVFPVSQDAMQIVRTLERLMRQQGVSVVCSSRISSVAALLDEYDAVLVTTGGGALQFLEGLPIEIEAPLPSLFTFNITNPALRALMGTVVEDASVSLTGTSFKAHGPLLITDWGMSGPAILKLSSYAARHLASTAYRATLAVNWLSLPESDARSLLDRLCASGARKQVSSTCPSALTSRLWAYLLERAGLRADIRWAEIGSKGLNRLVAVLTCDTYSIEGKSKFRDEFVTCGGVSLSSVDLNTLECKTVPGLFFAGEVLDIDAITGGFNLQAAWSTGWVAANSIAALGRE